MARPAIGIAPGRHVWPRVLHASGEACGAVGIGGGPAERRRARDGVRVDGVVVAVADRRREVVSYDVVHRPGLDRYLDLAGPDVRRRLELVCAAGDEGPRSDRPVELLYIDSSHERSATIREVLCGGRCSRQVLLSCLTISLIGNTRGASGRRRDGPRGLRDPRPVRTPDSCRARPVAVIDGA